jgi:hypothetical protein
MSAAVEGMTALELSTQREALRTALRRLDVIQVHCASCKQFELGTCSLHGNVPVSFQKSVDECDDWTFDGIPF